MNVQITIPTFNTIDIVADITENILTEIFLLETIRQEQCTKISLDTSIPCNEYASRKSYKEKLFSHPIHTEFTKSYNRLYARIRRGKLPADTPLMDQLKALHDEYIEKYENTHQKDREAVWKEYIEKNKELLKLDISKSQKGRISEFLLSYCYHDLPFKKSPCKKASKKTLGSLDFTE